MDKHPCNYPYETAKGRHEALSSKNQPLGHNGLRDHCIDLVGNKRMNVVISFERSLYVYLSFVGMICVSILWFKSFVRRHSQRTLPKRLTPPRTSLTFCPNRGRLGLQRTNVGLLRGDVERMQFVERGHGFSNEACVPLNDSLLPIRPVMSLIWKEGTYLG